MIRLAFVFILLTTLSSHAEDSCSMAPSFESINTILNEVSKMDETSGSIDRSTNNLQLARQTAMDLLKDEVSKRSAFLSTIIVIDQEDLESLIDVMHQIQLPDDVTKTPGARHFSNVKNAIKRIYDEGLYLTQCEADFITNLEDKRGTLSSLNLKYYKPINRASVRHAPMSETWTLSGAYLIKVGYENGESKEFKFDKLPYALPFFQ